MNADTVYTDTMLALFDAVDELRGKVHDMPSPDSGVDWADVGSAKRILSIVTALTDGEQ